MEPAYKGYPRVAVTGMGAITPLGTLDSFWKALQTGDSGIRSITQFDPSDLEVKIAGEVDFDPSEQLAPKEVRRMARASQLALIAARMALEDSGLQQEALTKEGDRIGVVIGTVYAGFAMLVDTAYDFTFRGRKPFPTALINGLPNMPGYYISLEMGATGPLTTISTACASGTQAIGVGLDLIRCGKADMVIAGGVDCLIRKEVIAAFDAMTVVTRDHQAAPEKASRPFDANRNGFVLSEGAGMMILESFAHAQARDGRIYAEILGHAASSDAAHIAAPDEDGLGAQKAMRWALQDAMINPDQVDYINAHGTGTKVNDLTETKAIKHVFGQNAYEIPISSTKSMIGHAMGASGALEAIVCVMTMRDGIVHPTINYEIPDPDCDLDYVPNTSRQATVQITLSNSFGLGGQNACLVLGAA